MSEPSKIIFIDDVPANLSIWGEACNIKLPQAAQDPICIRNEEEFITGRTTLITPDFLDRSLVLLDLGFQDSFAEVLKPVPELLNGLCNRIGNGWSWDPREGLKLTTNIGSLVIDSSSCEGLALIEVVLQNNPKKCLIDIVSGRGKNEEVKELVKSVETWISANNRSGNVAIIVGGQMPTQALTAQNLVQAGIDEWKRRFPDLHPIPRVNEILTGWLAAYDGLPQNERPNFCSHRNASTAGSIDGNPEYYQRILTRLFQYKSSVSSPIDTNPFKAIFQLEMPPASLDNSKTFPVAPSSLGPGDKSLSLTLAGELLGKISGMKVTTSGDAEMRLPCQPALPFLVSLVVLFETMKSQDDGMVDTNKPITLFGSLEGPRRISIPLRSRGGFSGKIGSRWVEKMCNFEGSIANDTKGGVCPALWHALTASVRGVNTTSQTDGAKANLLRLFDGPGRLVAGVSFGPYCINIHW
jgi:hypothetical protein